MSSIERREVAVGVLAVVVACLVAGGAAFLIARQLTDLMVPSTVAGLIVLVCTAVAGAVILVCSLDGHRRRRREIESLTERVDAVLRDPSLTQRFEDYNEGELAVLANELQKMTVRLRDQASGFATERDALADSLADISHQLRTPLMSMGITAELLADESLDPRRRRELTRDLRRSVDHMSWLMQSLLLLARSDAGTLSFQTARVPLAQLVRQAVEPLRIAFELADVELVLDLPDEGAAFEGDAGWTKEALGNIVKNCLEHTPAGGSVRVEARVDAIAARITVTDTGPGISPEDLPHIFERFYRGKNAAPGSAGIGLALARCLVTSQDGTLTAGNKPDGGARFRMALPLGGDGTQGEARGEARGK